MRDDSEHDPNSNVIVLLPKLNGRQMRRAAEINELFDEMREKYGLESLAIFLAAATGLHGKFLHDVKGCPRFVIEYVQQQLRPEALAERAKYRERERARIIGKAERTASKIV